MRPALKKASEYTDKELKQEFGELINAGILKKYVYRILRLHRSTFKSRMLRLENPQEYKVKNEKRNAYLRLNESREFEQNKGDYFFDVDAEALRKFRENLKKSKQEISVREAIDPYY